MKPSSFSIRAISSLMLEIGTSTFWCFAPYALRIRVSISAIGSVITSPQFQRRTTMMNDDSQIGVHHSALIIQPFLLSPPRLGDAGNMSFKRQPAKTDAAEGKLPQVTPAPPATTTAVVDTRGKDVQVQPCRFGALDIF